MKSFVWPHLVKLLQIKILYWTRSSFIWSEEGLLFSLCFKELPSNKSGSQGMPLIASF